LIGSLPDMSLPAASSRDIAGVSRSPSERFGGVMIQPSLSFTLMRPDLLAVSPRLKMDCRTG